METGSKDLTVEEEAVKRNTDCVYFLASPLTCKKGNECEYRHSEGARVNPRDCYFWINGNCLNPKCSFRHPPLDALLGTPRASAGSSLPPLQAPASMQMPVAAHAPPAYNSSKQATPCFYFQKGLCLKGDRCSFMHGSHPMSNPVPQLPKVTSSVTEPPQTLKNPTFSLEKCTSQQKISQVNISKSIDMPPMTKSATKAETAPSNGIAVMKNIRPTLLHNHHKSMAANATGFSGNIVSQSHNSQALQFGERFQNFKEVRATLLDNDLLESMATNVPGISGNAIGRSRSSQAQQLDEPFQNGKEVDEFLGESSPGFDVLVDDKVEDSDYYLNDGEFGRTAAGHGERHLTSVDEFDYNHSDRDSLPKFDREPYNDFRGYDQYGRVQDQSSWEHRRASSERILERSSITNRRGYARDESPDKIERSDLRHRLSKQRRVNGSRSANSPGHRREHHRKDDWYVKEQRSGDFSRGESQHFPRDSSRSNRLHGRITLPRRSSPDNRNDFRSDGGTDRGRNWGRSSSPGRPISFHGTHHDSMKRTQEDLTAEVRNSRGSSVKRDEVDPLNFAGPKSLAELKVAKSSDSGEERWSRSSNATGLKSQLEQKNLKVVKVVGHQESEGSLSFEGPKPLGMILKRKRGEGAAGDFTVSSNVYESNQMEGTDHKGGCGTTYMETQAKSEKEEEEEEGQVSAADDELVHDGKYSAQVEDPLEMEDGMMIETMEDEEPETYEHREGEFDDSGDFKTEDENADPDDEYLDDDDGDDFAKRIGVMFS
ncbi:zinc finger CCCH domain-containing protein 32-like [Tasmannia lanceolata]|uniref:zinc finger CCCH domain-containing protein 32-like n=1 Tax=Tasmannia lanceolata TaxID=3420 RepID=UPI004064C5B6